MEGTVHVYPSPPHVALQVAGARGLLPKTEALNPKPQALNPHASLQVAEARSLLLGVLRRDPRHLPSLHTLAGLEDRANMQWRATGLYRRATKLAPNSPMVGYSPCPGPPPPQPA